MEAVADADLVLVVTDASQPLTTADRELYAQVSSRNVIMAANKIDLADSRKPTAESRSEHSPIVPTSALTGEGMVELRAEILRHVGGDGAPQETGFLTNIRQQKLVEEALAGLQAATDAVPANTPHEMILLDLYNALRPLDEITGATTTEDILNLIFSTFCIGK
jgi:tRNA modification GTPase